MPSNKFFCPAILGPKLFGLAKEHPKEITSRTLTLVAKTILNLGNLVEFGQKEAFMNPMNELIVKNIDKMKKFLDTIATLPSEPKEKYIAETIDIDKELATIWGSIRKLKSQIQAQYTKAQKEELKNFNRVVDKMTEVEKKYYRSWRV